MKVLVVLGALICAGASFAASIKDGSSSFAVFCYYGSWANGRTGAGRFGVSDLPLDLCTHIVYSFLGLDGNGSLTFSAEETLEGKSNSVADLLALKKSNSSLKILPAIGGWSEGSENFSAAVSAVWLMHRRHLILEKPQMHPEEVKALTAKKLLQFLAEANLDSEFVVNNDTLRAAFVSNLYNYVDSNGFDGLDLDWEYPAQRGGIDSDKEQFVVLVKELKEKFTPKGYLLTSAVAVTQANIDLSYNVTELNKYLDFFNLMLYDFHGTWDTVTGVNAPLYPQLTDPSATLNGNHSVNVWIENGASPSKLVFGLAAYGKTFNLTSLNNTSTGAPFSGAGQAGPYLAEAGNYAYYEICEDQQANPALWNITEVTGNYVYANKGLFWVGYDNPNTIYAKAQYAKQKGLGGIMYWAIDLDDFNGLCGTKYPLIRQGIAGFKSG